MLKTVRSIVDVSQIVGVLPQSSGGTGAASLPAFSAYLNGSQAVVSGSFAKLQANVEEFDTANCYDTATFRFTPNVAGYYQFNGQIQATQSLTLNRLLLTFYKNGSMFKIGQDLTYSTTTGYARTSSSALIYLNGTTDYVELYGLIVTTGTCAFEGSSVDSYFQGFLARAA